MRPLRITLNNFGAVESCAVDFRGIHCASVCGDNGAGKSTIFTAAPRWALFGVGRSADADGVIRAGSDEASVHYMFEHHGRVYEIWRSRNRTGRGKSTLELFMLHRPEGPATLDDIMTAADGTMFGCKSLSGASIRETQERIGLLLSLDDSTLAASSLIMQGESGEFTRRPPSERKAMLSSILGLGIYDGLRDLAKERVISAKSAISQDEAVIRGKKEELERFAGALERARSETERRGSLEKEARHIEDEITKRNALLLEASEALGRLGLLDEEIKNLRGEWVTVKSKTGQMESSLAEVNELLSSEAVVLAKAGRHKEAADRLEALRPGMEKAAVLRAELANLRSAKEDVISALRLKDGQLKAALAKASGKGALDSAARETVEIEKQMEADAEREKQYRNAVAGQHKASLKAKEAGAEERKYREALAELEKKQAFLDNSACVNLAAATEAPCAFIADAVSSLAGMEDIRRKLSEAEELREKAVLELAEADRLCAALSPTPGEEEAANARAARRRELRRILDSQAEIYRAAAAVEAFEAEIAGLGWQLDGAEARISEKEELLRGYEPLAAETRELEDIMRATECAHSEAAQFHVLRERKRAIEIQIAEAEERAASLEAAGKKKREERAGASEAEARAAVISQELRRLREMDLPPVQMALDEAVSNSIRLWHEAEEEKRLRAQISEAEARVMPAREKLRQWESLAAAFGRDGIPALIIENAVPGLERIANGILSEMTFGENRLEFRTQRELKSKDALAETLDIIVTDWRGPRAYETFSGGERLRIDLAVRFALAELLANRSGNKVEWVVLDEGIGSQDEAHRNTVLEAIKRVSSRFALMLVITHIPEASASFPQQLRVERSGAGVEVLAS